MEWSLTAGHSYRCEQNQKWIGPWEKVNQGKSCWLTDRPRNTQGLKNNRETEPAGIMFKLGSNSQQATVQASENGTKWHSLWRMFASTLCQMISTAYTGKSSFIPGGTPWLNQSLADHQEYSVSWSQQDSPASMPCQVSSLNLIAAILTSMLNFVCKYIIYCCI